MIGRVKRPGAKSADEDAPPASHGLSARADRAPPHSDESHHVHLSGGCRAPRVARLDSGPREPLVADAICRSVGSGDDSRGPPSSRRPAHPRRCSLILVDDGAITIRLSASRPRVRRVPRRSSRHAALSCPARRDLTAPAALDRNERGLHPGHATVSVCPQNIQRLGLVECLEHADELGRRATPPAPAVQPHAAHVRRNSLPHLSFARAPGTSDELTGNRLR